MYVVKATNVTFMLITFLNANDLIGCGGGPIE